MNQRGTATVEFALALPIFIITLFVVVETARALYMVNTLAEASRRAVRAAAVVNFSDPAAIGQLKQRAMFDTPNGKLPFGDPVTTDSIQLSYLSSDGITPASPAPACPEQNLATCMANPNGPACIRYVRVRICQAGVSASCERITYQPLVDVGGFFGGIPLPNFEIVTPAGSLGLAPGAVSTCP